MKPGLFELIDRSLSGKEGWCTTDKAHTLAALVIATRPKTIVEIGVWSGSSLLPMALAAKTLGTWNDPLTRNPVTSRVIAIDPWNPFDSAKGQIPINAEWWGQAPHEWAYTTFVERLRTFEVEDIVTVVRASSEEAIAHTTQVPNGIDLLHIDGNHGVQAVWDVQNYAERVRQMGVLVLDDVNWDGGHVRKAADLAISLGFRPRYDLETGIVFQRLR